MIETLDRFLARALSVPSYQAFMVNHLDWLTTFQFHKALVEPVEEHPVTVMGLRFPNRVGISAGIDVNAAAVSALGGLGAGFVEIGPVSCQAEHHQGDIVKITSEEALRIKKLAPSCGISALSLKNAYAFKLRGGIVGMNLGACPDKTLFMAASRSSVDYLSVRLTDEALASQFLSALSLWSEELTAERTLRKPIAVEVPSGLGKESLAKLIESAQGCPLDAWMTPSGINSENGLICGHSVFESTLCTIQAISQNSTLPIIAKGGIFTPQEAFTAISHGASLVELGSALLFNGLRSIGQTVKRLSVKQ